VTKIRYLDGIRLYRAILAGSNWVTRKQQLLNRINVFPVPDGDTGTNMALTLQSIAEGVQNCPSKTVDGISQAISDSALLGARGNSGVILAQFFQGLSEGFKGRIRITTRHFAQAVRRAVASAYAAMSKPQEGTILTVIREWGEHIQQMAHKTQDFVELIRESLKTARKSLQETPKKLKILEKAGVVDAGAQGFVYMLEGILHFIESGKVESVSHSVAESKQSPVPMLGEPLPFRFCTECLMEGAEIPHNSVKECLDGLGDSVIVAGTAQKVRIHIHTNEPEKVFQMLEGFGRIHSRKVDDMLQRHQEIHLPRPRSSIALVTDSSCDLPESVIQRYNIHVVPLRIYLGDTEYVDRVTIQPRAFYQKLRETGLFPRTSQPAPGDFLRVYRKLAQTHKSIISIHLSGRLSGTFSSAQRAAQEVSGVPIAVLDGSTVSVALGLIVEQTAQAIEKGLSHAEIVRLAKDLREKVRIYATVPTMKYLIHGGRVGRLKGLVSRLLHVRPLIAITPEGVATVVGKAFSLRGMVRKLWRLVESKARGLRNLRFAVAHADCPETANWYVEKIKERFGVEEVMVVEAAVVLGAHAGPGASAIAFLGEP